MKDRCNTCGRLIWWLEHERTESMAPIEEAPPFPDGGKTGNVVPMVFRDVEVKSIDDATHYRVIGVRKGQASPATGYRSHYASCPDAQSWRAKKGLPPEPSRGRRR